MLFSRQTYSTFELRYLIIFYSRCFLPLLVFIQILQQIYAYDFRPKNEIVGIISNIDRRMPIQTPQWTDFLICPICCNEYDFLHNPISLGCGHTLCKPCLSKLQRKQCPYDQVNILHFCPQFFLLFRQNFIYSRFCALKFY